MVRNGVTFDAATTGVVAESGFPWVTTAAGGITLDEDAVNRQDAMLGASVDLHRELARLASGFLS